MTKAASFSLGLIFLLASFAQLPAQTSATDMAVNRAVLNQANTIVLRQKLVDAKSAAASGDLVSAARLYQDACGLAVQIGSGIDAETTQAISGLASTRLELARQAQSQGDLIEANNQVIQVLQVDPKNSAALAFKKQNDEMTVALRGKMPDTTTLEQIPVVADQKVQADTLVRDGKLFYEMGKLEDAEDKLQQALHLDPDNQGAIYYLNLAKQARFDREEHKHAIDNQDRMVQVEDAWVRPNNTTLLPVPNPYAMTNLIHTGLGREVIVSKLDRIQIDAVSWPDGLPLTEVIRDLTTQAKLRDPDKRGINFLWNGNGDESAEGSAPAAGAGAVDPNTGLPVAAPGGGGESAIDANNINIKLTLNDVRLQDVLDAVVLVADHPIKYSIEDYAIVFSPKAAESPQLYTRTFKVDANTFYQGLQSVGAFTFGAANFNNNGSSGSSSGGGNSSGGNNGSSGSSSSGAVVPVVNIAPGAGGLRGGNGNGGGGGGGAGATPGGGGGGVDYLTKVGPMEDVSVAARTFFSTLGVNLDAPKSLFFNDRLGLLFVRATEQDLDTIESAIQTLNQVPPMVHIKARFIEVEQDDSTALGFDWYLGQFGNTVTVSGGTEASQNVPTSAANPLGIFPGNTAASAVAGAATDQLLTGGLQNSGPALATITGIMTDPNFRVVLHALEQRSGFENLAEPEVTTLSGRQTQMRATEIQTIITSFSFQQGTGGTATPTTTP